MLVNPVHQLSRAMVLVCYFLNLHVKEQSLGVFDNLLKYFSIF